MKNTKRTFLQTTAELFRISDCKTAVGDFSTTYQIDIKLTRDEEVESFRTSEVSGEEEISFIAKLLPADDPGRMCVFEANLFEKEIEVRNKESLPSIIFL